MSGGLVVSVIAVEINREHAQAVGKAREALEHARRAGDLLLQAKVAVEHGDWLPWITTHCAFTPRTAQRYIQLAENWDKLTAKCDTGVSHLGFKEAIGLLSEPSRPKKSTEHGVHHEGDEDHVDGGGDPAADLDPESARAFEDRRQLADLLLAWSNAGPQAREGFVANKLSQICDVVRTWQKAA